MEFSKIIFLAKYVHYEVLNTIITLTYSGHYFSQDWISSKPLKAYSITVSVRAPRATQLVATAW